jgi:hypothetical protein
LCALFPNVKLFSCEGGGCGVEMECIQASCMHLFPSPGKRSCRDNNNSRNSNAARELVVARSLEGETAGDFPPSCSYGNIHTHTYPCFFFFFSETLIYFCCKVAKDSTLCADMILTYVWSIL